jgi:hypothetical protein
MTRSCESSFIPRNHGSSVASIRVLQHNPLESGHVWNADFFISSLARFLETRRGIFSAMCAGHCANRCLRDRPASGYGGTVVRQHPLIPLTLCEGHFPTLKLTNEPLLRPQYPFPKVMSCCLQAANTYAPAAYVLGVSKNSTILQSSRVSPRRDHGEQPAGFAS